MQAFTSAHNDPLVKAAAKILSEAPGDNLSDEDKKTIALVKKAFPSGSKLNYSGELEWRKQGGYAGEKSIGATTEKLEKLGFKHTKGSLIGLPDGSTSGFNSVLANTKLGWYVTVISFYGQTAARNSFSLVLKKIPNDKV